MMWWSEGRDQPVVKQLCSAALGCYFACFTCSLARCRNFGKDWTVSNFGYCGRNKKNSSPKLEPLWNRFTVLDSQISVLSFKSVFLRKKEYGRQATHCCSEHYLKRFQFLCFSVDESSSLVCGRFGLAGDWWSMMLEPKGLEQRALALVDVKWRSVTLWTTFVTWNDMKKSKLWCHSLMRSCQKLLGRDS